MDETFPSQLEWRNEKQCSLPVLTCKSIYSKYSSHCELWMERHVLAPSEFAVQWPQSYLYLLPFKALYPCPSTRTGFQYHRPWSSCKSYWLPSQALWWGTGATLAQFMEDFWLQLCCSRIRCYCTYIHPDHILLVTRSPCTLTSMAKLHVTVPLPSFHLRCLGESAFFK